VPAHTVLPMPTNLSFEESATLGVAGLTAAMTLWRWLLVPEPSFESMQRTPNPLDGRTDDEYLLIWGGAAITGQFAIQIARLSGIKTICVASAKTSSLCLSLGASHVIARDGKSAESIIAEIRAIAGDSITMAVDLVGTETAGHCLKAVSQRRSVLFAPLAMMSNSASIPTNVQVQTVEMKRFVLEQENAVYAQRLNDLVQSGRVKVPALEVVEGGFAMIEEGLRRLKSGDRSGKKIVVQIP
jgi:NADPH:quinone reductase-like Zn-dependent oxidoreductase